MQFLKNKTLAIHSLLYLKNLHESLNILREKIEPHDSNISEVIDSEKRCYLNA